MAKVAVYVDGQGKPQHLAVPLEMPPEMKQDAVYRSFCGADVNSMVAEQGDVERVVCPNCDKQLKMYREVKNG